MRCGDGTLLPSDTIFGTMLETAVVSNMNRHCEKRPPQTKGAVECNVFVLGVPFSPLTQFY